MKQYKITVNGVTYDVSAEEVGASAPAAQTVQAAPAPQPVSEPAPAAPAPVPEVKATPGEGTPVNAPMPGTVLDVQVKAGQQISKGDVLIILEAMKMENEIMAPQDGVVTSVAVKKGDSVNSNDLIATIS